MSPKKPKFEVRLAESPADLRAAQRLRYRVFVEELGGDGELVDHACQLETDRFDPFFDHLLLLDHNQPGEPDPEADGVLLPPVVGVYRLLRSDQASKTGGFYSADEYDLTPLLETGRKLLELGRSCVHADYRGGTAMFHLWNGLAHYVLRTEVKIMFGVASFHGTDIEPLRQPLSYLHHNHLAPEDLRVSVRTAHSQSMDLLPPEQIDRRKAMLETPALIKAYIRLGGFVGEGAFIDHEFNTTDVCLIIDTEKMNPGKRDFYVRKGTE